MIDERFVQKIEDIPDTVLNVWESVSWRSYKTNDGMTRVGLVAQHIKSVFENHGLDAVALGIISYEEWNAVTEPVYVKIKKTRTIQVPTGIALLSNPPIQEMRDEIEEYFEDVATGENRIIVEAGNEWKVNATACFVLEAACTRRKLFQMEQAILEKSAEQQV